MNVGDRVVYCEIDSLLPERPEFEFLRPSSFKQAIREGETVLMRAGFRIKTVKLRGQVSQGICFPLSFLPPDAPTDEGADVTEILDVAKYEPPAPAGMGGSVKGAFPGFLPKTDETRIQVLESVLERHRGQPFFITEKLDGTSFTAFLRGGEFGICSRNLWLDDNEPSAISNILVRLAKQLDLRTQLQVMQATTGFDVAIQGEVIGPGIQKNKYGLSAVELRVFNVFNVSESRFVDHEAAFRLMRESALTPVPQLGTIELNHTVDELVQFSIGMSVLNPKTHREGIVLRPPVEVDDPDLKGRLSFKVINPQFLLKYDE